MDESNCRLVSSRGLLKSCTLHSRNPHSSYSGLNDYVTDFIKVSEVTGATGVKTGDSLYLCLTALPKAVKILDSLPCAVVLVSGDDDVSVNPSDDRPEFLQILNHPKVIAWWTQNYAASAVGSTDSTDPTNPTNQHPKLKHLPIGLDYHTMTQSGCWGPLSSCADQERLLLSIKAQAKPFSQRQLKCYSNFHLTAFHRTVRFQADRIAAVQEVPTNLVAAETRFVTRAESWLNQSRYAFILSPHGNGLDCHRTWEGLCLGCIVIVKTSSLDPLYADLPVLIVTKWSDITAELLTKTVSEFTQRSFNYAKLELKYWLDLIRADGDKALQQSGETWSYSVEIKD